MWLKNVVGTLLLVFFKSPADLDCRNWTHVVLLTSGFEVIRDDPQFPKWQLRMGGSWAVTPPVRPYTSSIWGLFQINHTIRNMVTWLDDKLCFSCVSIDQWLGKILQKWWQINAASPGWSCDGAMERSSEGGRTGNWVGFNWAVAACKTYSLMISSGMFWGC